MAVFFQGGKNYWFISSFIGSTFSSKKKKTGFLLNVVLAFNLFLFFFIFLRPFSQRGVLCTEVKMLIPFLSFCAVISRLIVLLILFHCKSTILLLFFYFFSLFTFLFEVTQARKMKWEKPEKRERTEWFACFLQLFAVACFLQLFAATDWSRVGNFSYKNYHILPLKKIFCIGWTG